MNIRRAEIKDTEKILLLLSEVLEIHAEIRPDIFVSGTTKYTVDELEEIINDYDRPIFVAVDENDVVIGYAFCIIKAPPFSTNMVKHKIMFIDDLCVDINYRGKRIGYNLFEFVKKEAKSIGCYEITLNVWEGNDKAKLFYEKLGMKTKETQLEFIL